MKLTAHRSRRIVNIRLRTWRGSHNWKLSEFIIELLPSFTLH